MSIFCGPRLHQQLFSTTIRQLPKVPINHFISLILHRITCLAFSCTILLMPLYGEKTGQDRLHQVVRSLEALLLPDIGKTRKQFVQRCHTFARALRRHSASSAVDTRTVAVASRAIRIPPAFTVECRPGTPGTPGVRRRTASRCPAAVSAATLRTR